MLQKMRRQHWIALFAIAVIYSYTYAVFISDIRDGKSDFVIFYTAGTMVRTANSSDLYVLETQRQFQRSVVPLPASRPVPLPFNHPPTEAVFFAPISLLSYTGAFTTWFAISGATLFAFLVLVDKRLVLGNWFLFLALACAAFLPSVICMVQGQDSIWQLFLLSFGLIEVVRGHHTVAGILLASATFRPQFVLPLLIALAIAGFWRTLAAFVVGCVALCAVTVPFTGIRPFVEYPGFLLQFVRMPVEQVPLNPALMPNLRGLLHETDYARYSGIFGFVLAFLAFVLLWPLLRRLRMLTPSMQLVALSSVLIFSLMIVSHVNAHDLVLLLVPIAAIFSNALRDPQSTIRRRILVVSAVLAWMVPEMGMHFRLIFFSNAVLMAAIVWAAHSEINRRKMAPQAEAIFSD
jgi:hypothetical protein